MLHQEIGVALTRHGNGAEKARQQAGMQEGRFDRRPAKERNGTVLPAFKPSGNVLVSCA